MDLAAFGVLANLTLIGSAKPTMKITTNVYKDEFDRYSTVLVYDIQNQD
jgi:hypothetical protein